MMSPPQRRGSRPLVRRIVTRSQALLGEQFSAPKPSFRHAPPSFLVLGLAGRSGHQLAFGGMLQKLVRWVDRDHYSFSFFTPRSPLLEYRHWRSEQAAREIAVLEFSDRIEARTWAANKTRTPISKPSRWGGCNRGVHSRAYRSQPISSACQPCLRPARKSWVAGLPPVVKKRSSQT